MIVWTILGGFQDTGAVLTPTPAPLHGPVWLKPPYYIAPPEIWATDPSFGVALSNESYLQMMLESTMSDISAYLNPAFQTGLTAKTAAAIVANYQATVVQREAILRKLTGDPLALGLKYGNMQVSLMKQIQSAPGSGVSLWIAWVG